VDFDGADLAADLAAGLATDLPAEALTVVAPDAFDFEAVVLAAAV
jgi:hypothetical protein